jgi:hypothetical protein
MTGAAEEAVVVRNGAEPEMGIQGNRVVLAP